MSLIPVHVECYSGSRADEAPRAVCMEGRRLEVAAITDRWYEGGVDPGSPVIDYFKLQTTCGETLLLRHEHETHVWYLVLEGPRE